MESTESLVQVDLLEKKNKINAALNSKEKINEYWNTVEKYLRAQLWKPDFDKIIQKLFSSPEQLRLHNELFAGILFNSLNNLTSAFSRKRPFKATYIDHNSKTRPSKSQKLYHSKNITIAESILPEYQPGNRSGKISKKSPIFLSPNPLQSHVTIASRYPYSPLDTSTSTTTRAIQNLPIPLSTHVNMIPNKILYIRNRSLKLIDQKGITNVSENALLLLNKMYHFFIKNLVTGLIQTHHRHKPFNQKNNSNSKIGFMDLLNAINIYNLDKELFYVVKTEILTKLVQQREKS